MTVRNLDSLFRPNSVAVIGASNTPGSVGTVVFRNMLRAEFAIIVRSGMKGGGLGHALMEKVFRYCGDRRTGSIVGQVLPDNHRMLALVDRPGFTKHHDGVGEVVEVRLELATAGGPPP